MKPRAYVIVVALFLAGIFILWPRFRTDPANEDAAGTRPRESDEIRNPGTTSREFLRAEPGEDDSPAMRVPESAEIEVTPETPPEPTLEWQIARQQAMLKSLRRHIEISEARWRTATNDLERQTIQGQIEVLRAELARKQEELVRLEEQSAN